MRIVVNTSAYAQASAELSSAQVFVRQALDGLSSGLAGAHQMAGNDDAGTTFANDYDEAAGNLVGGITDALTGAGVLSKLLADTANVWSDAEHNASGGIAPLGLASSMADTSDLSGTCSMVSPTALGGRSDFVPEGWEWVQSVVGAVWPNGDAGKLRSAQAAWQRAGDDLRSAAGKVDAASSALGGLVTPELSLVLAKLEQYRGYLNDLSTSSHSLGQGCAEYADGIEEAHTAIIQELQELLITTVAVEAGAALLAVFTLGASEVVGNAALMARIGLTGTRVAAMIARLVEVAATVGARMAGITGTITRTVGMLREIKVVKTLTYLGTKAPAPIRAMTGIAFNSAVSVGIDAAMHGGTPVNVTHDILLGGISPFGAGAAVNAFKTGTSTVLKNGMIATNGVVRIPMIELKFAMNPKHNPIEFDRQIVGQESGLNSMSVADFLKNRDAVLERLAAGRPIRPSEAGAAQQDARNLALSEKIKDLRNQGISGDEAEVQALAWMNSQAALHNPDIISGGFPTILSGVGDSRINSSIGSQWRTRINAFDAQVRHVAANLSQAERENTLIHVKLNY